MDLSVTVPMGAGSLTFKNPVMAASGTFGNIVEYLDIFDITRLGAVVSNSFLPWQGEPNRCRRFAHTENGYLSAFGINNMTLEHFIAEVLPRLPAEDVPVFVNIKAPTRAQLVGMIRACVESGRIAGVEVNGNFPYAGRDEPSYWDNPAENEAMFRALSAAADGKVVLWSKAATSAKMIIEDFVSGSERGGADGTVLFNAIPGARIDIERRAFVCGSTGFGGYSGSGVKPFALWRCVQAARVASRPVIGSGGITTAEDVVEFIMAGAHMVQIGAASMSRPDYFPRLLDDLQALLERLGVRSLDEIRGCARVEAAPED
jgi:dihydroorotate dehydrogenase (NAD+) catalytic subunit